MICPFFADQPFWGRCVHALGAGPPPIPQRKLSPKLLAEAIRAATTDPQIVAAAEAIGARLRSECGVENTVAWIERWMQSRSASRN